MTVKLLKKLLFILLQIALFTFLFAVPMPMSMIEVGEMDAHHSAHSSSQNQNSPSSMPCCDVIGSPCLFGVFITTELTAISAFAKNQQILNSNLAVKFIIVQNISPPPKA